MLEMFLRKIIIKSVLFNLSVDDFGNTVNKIGENDTLNGNKN